MKFEDMKTQADLDAAIKEAVDGEVTGLKAKNGELIADNKKLKAAHTELDGRMHELEEAAEEAAKSRAEKDGDVKSAVEAANKKAQKEIDKLKSDLVASTGRVQKHLVDGGLTNALVKAGVAKEYLPAVHALLKAQHKFDVTDEAVQMDGKDLADYVSEWAQGDSGKVYLAADRNGGSGSQGANGTGTAGSGNTVTREDYDKMSPAERSQFVSKNDHHVVDN